MGGLISSTAQGKWEGVYTMTLHDLFNAIDTENRLDNPFVTTEGERLYKALCTEMKRLGEDTSELLDKIMMYERKNSFVVGFKTAIELSFLCQR